MNEKQKEVFKQDRITQAVDKFNESLKDLGVCVGVVNYVKDLTAHKASQTAIYDEKVIERRTFKYNKIGSQSLMCRMRFI